MRCVGHAYLFQQLTLGPPSDAEQSVALQIAVNPQKGVGRSGVQGCPSRNLTTFSQNFIDLHRAKKQTNVEALALPFQPHSLTSNTRRRCVTHSSRILLSCRFDSTGIEKGCMYPLTAILQDIIIDHHHHHHKSSLRLRVHYII